MPDIEQEIPADFQARTLRTVKAFVTTPEDGRDHVILRVHSGDLEQPDEFVFYLLREDFFVLVAYLVASADEMRGRN